MRFVDEWFGAYMYGAPPEPKRTSNPTELAFWFTQFGWACGRAARIVKGDRQKEKAA